MPYFKFEDQYFEGANPPFNVDKAAPFLINGVQSDIPDNFLDTYTGFVPVEYMQLWQQIPRAEFLAHESLQSDLISLQDRDIQASMWALNHSTHTTLLYGGIYPTDMGDLGGVQLASRKYEIILMTQHRNDPSIPNQKRGNVAITRWITSRRRTSPFIYIGE